MTGPVPFNAAAWLVDRHVDTGGGDRTAYRWDGGTLTYAGLLEETWRAGNLLTGLGVEPGDRVLMLVRDEPAFPAFFLGALRIGAVPVPVSTMLKESEVAVLAADSQSRVAVASEVYRSYLPTLADAAPGLRAAVVIDGADPVGGLPASLAVHDWSGFTDRTELSPHPTGRDTGGFWLYTSGTTGRPKGAVHRHGDIEAVAATYARTVLAIGPDDVCYSVAKLFFAFGLGNALFFPLSGGRGR
jgi:benzoate-CoA ligase